MKKTIISFIVTIISLGQIYSQTSADLLENGVRVKPNEKIFLKLVKKGSADEEKVTLKIDVSENEQGKALNFTRENDSLFYLLSRKGVNIYLRPFNPLNYSYKSESKVIVDPIDEELDNSIGLIFDLFKNTSQPQAVFEKSMFESVLSDTIDNNVSVLTVKLNELNKLLQKDQKKEIVRLFTKLKQLDFTDKDKTERIYEETLKESKLIEEHFKEIDSTIENIETEISELKPSGDSKIIEAHTHQLILESAINKRNEKYKRYENLLKAFKLIEEQIKLSNSSEEEWFILVDDIINEKGEITIFTVRIYESGLKLSDDNEIVSVEPKMIAHRTIRARRFQTFIPEFAVGVVYTFIDYKSYFTTSDSTGQHYVAEPLNKNLENVNVTAMINWNLYVPNSPVLPFYQIGAGLNDGVPILLTGFGIRSGTSGKSAKRIAISGGIAMSWTKELDKLEVGQKVSGANEIEEDLKSKFTWPPKAYIGIQYNF